MMSILFYILIYPLLIKLKFALKNKKGRILLIIVSILLILDCIISALACIRMYERDNNIEPRNAIERIIDKKYPDEYLDRIYNNAHKTNRKRSWILN